MSALFPVKTSEVNLMRVTDTEQAGDSPEGGAVNTNEAPAHVCVNKRKKKRKAE